ncbi:MAG: Arc family DNA-binding protein [Agrobacterium cavarae]
MAPKQTDPQFKLRMTPAVKDAIESAASENGRSMNAEILARLEASFDLNSISLERLKFFEDMYERNNQERNDLIDTINKQDLIVQQMKREHRTLVLLARSISGLLIADAAIPNHVKAMAQVLDQLEEDNESDRSEELEMQPWEYE